MPVFKIGAIAVPLNVRFFPSRVASVMPLTTAALGFSSVEPKVLFSQIEKNPTVAVSEG